MADSNETRERQRELEEKKRRLDELRAAKLSRQRIDGRASLMIDTKRAKTMTPAELRAMLDSVGIESKLREEAPSDPSSTNSTSRECNGVLYLENHIGNNALNANARVKRPQNLSIIPAQSISIKQPRTECLQYCKTTQTDDEKKSDGEFSMGSQEFAFDDEVSIDEGAGLQIGSFDESPTREIRKHLNNLQFNNHGQHFKSFNKKDTTDDHTSITLATCTKMPPLSDEEKRKILSSSDFSRFFSQASRVIERALAEEADIFVDYINGTHGSGTDDKIDNREMLTFNRKIFDEKTTANRAVRAIDFSSIHAELMAVSYDLNREAPLAPDSIINLWTTRFKTSTPEATFTSSSRVMSLTFDPFKDNIIIGGCYSGQICIWDVRVNKKMPVYKTSLSSTAHTQPVLCMRMVGSTNAHDLVTVSTDGRLCSWNIDNMQQPIDSHNLMCPKTKKQMSALCMSFAHGSIKDLVLGDEDNQLYIVDRHIKDTCKSIPAHSMPITTVDMHRAKGPIDFSSLCLTGSLDFSIKLWDLKDLSKSEPLLCVERKHKFYITDVQWSPVHPAVFASLSSDGTLNLWNLNKNTENPLTSLDIGVSTSRLHWSRNGQQLIIGDSSGCLHIYDVNESLYNVRPGEWEDFERTIKEDLAFRTVKEDLGKVDGLAMAPV
ncbi:unnamed protein product [Meloidogyne enterolobii]|uniref:Uncharacterized protein n=1 Tax=Meloidogyne enterolobii TaxID=390850 RepID=A0ACB0YK65_MELEN